MSNCAEWIGGLALTGSRGLFGCPRRKTLIDRRGKIKISRGHRVEDPEGKKLWSFDGCLRSVRASGSANVVIADAECLDCSRLCVFAFGASLCRIPRVISNLIRVTTTGSAKVTIASDPSGEFTTETCVLGSGGGSAIVAKVTASDMEVFAAGASKVSGFSVTRNCEVRASGAGSINGRTSHGIENLLKHASGASEITLVSF
jgi:hypothetical protein